LHDGRDQAAAQRVRPSDARVGALAVNGPTKTGRRERANRAGNSNEGDARTPAALPVRDARPVCSAPSGSAKARGIAALLEKGARVADLENVANGRALVGRALVVRARNPIAHV